MTRRASGAAWAVALMMSACAADESASPPTPSPHMMSADVRPGEFVEVPVQLESNGVVAMQFDLHYDPAIAELAETVNERVPGSPDKAFTVRHLGAGTARVAVFGPDLDAIPPGVLGTLRLRGIEVADDMAVTGDRRVVVDAEGQRLTSTFEGGRLAVMAGEVKHARP